MNKEAKKWYQTRIVEMLEKCTEGEIHKFKQMYSFDNFNDTIVNIVDKMEEDCLDRAMEQISNTLEKRK